MVIGLIFFSSEELDNWTKCMKKLQTWDNRKHRSVMLERRKIYFIPVFCLKPLFKPQLREVEPNFFF